MARFALHGARSLARAAARIGLALLLLGLAAPTALALPAFAVQTGDACVSCHVGGFGPQLTPRGREFKMGGYTMRTTSFNIPLSTMIQASYVQTQKDQASPPAPHYGTNDNGTIDQISLFLAGGVGSHLGGFVQGTFDGVARAFHWDNLDLRAVTTASVKGVNTVFGISVNNAPTVQDAFNTLPAWGFAYTTSSLAPAPGTAPLIGNLAQDTIGATTYVWINSEVYAEFGGYSSPGQNFLARAGVDPFSPGSIKGVAPYGRLAYQWNAGDWNVQGGGFGMQADINPGRDTTTGLTDHYTDLGVDGSFQYYAANKDVFTINARYTHQRQDLQASEALGLAASARGSLEDYRIDASYYWRDKIGLTVGGFNTSGTSDASLYSSNRTLKPNSSGVTAQVDDTLFGGGGSPLGPRFNLRLGLQYTAYTEFNGASRNWDGAGANAAQNNTFRVFAWAAY